MRQGKSTIKTSETIANLTDMYENESLKTEMINDLICLVSALNSDPDWTDSTEKQYLSEIIVATQKWAEYYSQTHKD